MHPRTTLSTNVMTVVRKVTSRLTAPTLKEDGKLRALLKAKAKGIPESVTLVDKKDTYRLTAQRVKVRDLPYP